MKTTLRKISALLLAAAMMMPAFACANKNSNPDSTAEVSSSAEGENESSDTEGGEGVDFQIDDPNDPNSTKPAAESTKKNDAAATTAATQAGNNNKTTTAMPEIVTDSNGGQNNRLVFNQPTPEQEAAANAAESIVTTRRGSDGQYYVAQTDINGAVVTEANGEAKTEVYTGTTVAAQYEEPSYQPDQKTYQAYWLDISKRQNFVFDGNLLEFELKVADDAKDGVYPIEIYFTDFSNYEYTSLSNIACRPGYLCINSDEPAAAPITDGQMTLTPDTFSAKPGDTVRMNVRIDNNPGIVAFVVRMHYDANVMTITDAGAGSDLGERAPLTASPLAE